MYRFGLPVIVLVAVALGISGCGGGAPGGGVEPAGKPGELTSWEIRALPYPKARAYELDLVAREDIASKEWETLEAREWLKEERHGGGEAAKEELQKLAEDFYAAGAKMVYVTGIAVFKPEDFGITPANEEEAKGRAVSDTMIVELPEDAAARKAVIDLAVKYYAEVWEEEYPAEDYGQQYIRFQFG